MLSKAQSLKSNKDRQRYSRVIAKTAELRAKLEEVDSDLKQGQPGLSPNQQAGETREAESASARTGKVPAPIMTDRASSNKVVDPDQLWTFQPPPTPHIEDEQVLTNEEALRYKRLMRKSAHLQAQITQVNEEFLKMGLRTGESEVIDHGAEQQASPTSPPARVRPHIITTALSRNSNDTQDSGVDVDTFELRGRGSMPPPVSTIAEDKGGEDKDHDEVGTVFSMSEFSEFTEGSGDLTSSPTTYYSSDKTHSTRAKHASITEGWLLEQERRRRRNQGWSGTSYDDEIEKDEEEEIVLNVEGSIQEQQARNFALVERMTQQKQSVVKKEEEVEEEKEENLDYGVLARIQLPNIENVTKPRITNFLSQTYRLGNLEVTRHRAPGIKAVPPCHLATDSRTGERMAVKRFWLGKPTSGWRGFQVFDHRVSGVGIRPSDEDVWLSVREILARIGGLPDARTSRHFFRQGTKIYIAYALDFK